MSTAEKLDEAAESDRRASLDDRIEGFEANGAAAKRSGDVPIPVCALASCGVQPLLAVGLSHGVVHIMFVKQVLSRVNQLWFAKGSKASCKYCRQGTSLQVASEAGDKGGRSRRFQSPWTSRLLQFYAGSGIVRLERIRNIYGVRLSVPVTAVGSYQTPHCQDLSRSAILRPPPRW